LAAPERHPCLPPVFNRYGPFVSRHVNDDQRQWAAGAHDDREQNIVDEPHDEEAEGDKEPSLGALLNHHDQSRWASGDMSDREQDGDELDTNGSEDEILDAYRTPSRELVAEALAMRDAATRLREIIARVRSKDVTR
jgi:hypothetical protein